jgi:hypothetical protein
MGNGETTQHAQDKGVLSHGMWFLVLIVALLLIIGGASAFMTMPDQSYHGRLKPLTGDEAGMSMRLAAHVRKLAGEIGERTVEHSAALERSGEYVEEEFVALGFNVRTQDYFIGDTVVRNIEAEKAGTRHPDEIVLVGAHYDSPPGSPGANDNGSGVAALLELARIFKDKEPARTIRFVAFVNEEPPYFMTDDMGSRVYARHAKELGETIVAMLSLETIGYYSDEKGSQLYPAPLHHFYPDTGNFIAFIGNLASRNLVHRCIATFRRTAAFPSEGAAVPGVVPGAGWSDHWSFWQEGYPAIMVTDTAPFRYPYYHEALDTPDKLDYDRMARVVSGLTHVILELADN